MEVAVQAVTWVPGTYPLQQQQLQNHLSSSLVSLFHFLNHTQERKDWYGPNVKLRGKVYNQNSTFYPLSLKKIIKANGRY